VAQGRLSGVPGIFVLQQGQEQVMSMFLYMVQGESPGTSQVCKSEDWDKRRDRRYQVGERKKVTFWLLPGE
jgi:hypothetical protein